MEKYKMSEEKAYPQKIYASQLVTVNDLHEFKKSILQELLAALKTFQQPPAKRWMKSHEVRRMLKISPDTLQNLKNSRVIPYTKIGGVHFYDYEDILRLLQSDKVNSR